MINVKMNTWARQYISNLVVGYTKAIQKQKNERCHFNKKCLCSTSPFGYVKVQIIEQVYLEDPSNI